MRVIGNTGLGRGWRDPWTSLTEPRSHNAHTIPNYAERHHFGERVSTAFVESKVNTVVGKRFSKRQQMRWSRSGAHLMLQTGTRVLDGTLRIRFQSWYPRLFTAANTDQAMERTAA